MKDFLFRPEQARTPVKALSGGEKARLMLARALAKPVQSPRPRRADQRPRSRDARSPPGDAGRLSRHADHGEPRPRLHRPGGDLDARRGRHGRALDGICRRLFRHGRPAGARHRRQARRPEQSGAGITQADRTASGDSVAEAALLQGRARAEGAAGTHRRALGGDPAHGDGAVRRRPLPPRPEEIRRDWRSPGQGA